MGKCGSFLGDLVISMFKFCYNGDVPLIFDPSGRNMSIISIVDKNRSLSVEFDSNQSTNIGCR